MLDRFAPLAHLLGVLVEPPLDGLEDVFVLPAGDPALPARGAAILDGASLAGRGPVAAQGQPVLLVRVAVDQAFAGRAKIDIVCGHIDKVLFDEPALGPAARGQRLGKGDRDTGFIAGQDFLAFEVAAVGNDIQRVSFQSGLGPFGHGEELRAVGAHIGDFVGDDQMMLGVHRGLHVVAHHAAAPAACRHGAGVGIGERDLPVRCRKPPDLKLF